MIARKHAVAALAAGAVVLVAALTGCPTPVTPVVGTVALQTIASGFTSPVDLQFPPDNTGRAFVVDQTGTIFVIANGAVLPAPFLDVRSRMVTLMPNYDERGLLGLAFHPSYATNRRFFVFYNAPPGADTPAGFNNDVHVSEFAASASDPNQADPNSEKILLSIPHPQFNNDGGQLAFGPDGMLYVSLGDGGGSGDVGFGHTPVIGNAQDLSKLLGKILRIDVNSATPFAIPSNNPFVNTAGARGEIWAFGLRNPFRFSFDRQTGRLFTADAGEALEEEVDIIAGGGNYGWNIREGLLCFDPNNPTVPPATCSSTGFNGEPLINPIIAIPHTNANGQAVTIVVNGGYVYRGAAIPALQGRYIFGNFSTTSAAANGRVLVGTEQQSGAWTSAQLGVQNFPNVFVQAFGQDPSGEVYVLTKQNLGPTGTTGVVYRLAPGSIANIGNIGNIGGGTGTTVVSFTNQVQPIFNAFCTLCHRIGGSGQTAGITMVLTTGRSYQSIVAQPSFEEPNLLLVNPGDPNTSYLFRKVALPNPGVGSQMPLMRPPLSQADLATIRDWIAQGAPNN